ncbi:MAG: alpha/beta hydrolase, partial [Betaproteobacteria bacterium HGW-Betaproteobacteria-14]
MHNTHHWYEFDLLQSPGLVRLALEWRAPWEFGASIAAKPL